MKLYIFPGLGQKPKDFHWLIDNDKYEVVFVRFDLKKASFKSVTSLSIDKNSAVLGFSIGALVAYKLEASVRLGIYCSMSTLLGQHAIRFKKEISEIFTASLAEELGELKYAAPRARKYKMFYGEEETDEMTKKFKAAKIVAKSGHWFSREYKQEVLRALGIEK